MDDKLKTIVKATDDEQRRRLAVHDALRERLRVEIMGVDIVAMPRLPDELRRGAAPVQKPDDGKP